MPFLTIMVISMLCGDVAYSRRVELDDGKILFGIYREKDLDALNIQLKYNVKQSHFVCDYTAVYYTLKDYKLTQEHIDILKHCPITEIKMTEGTSCLDENVSDLRSFSQLQELTLNNCNSKNFTITDLPETISYLSIKGLSVENVQLSNFTGNFSRKESFVVSEPEMCCPKNTVKMFRTLLPPDTCMSSRGWTCGLASEGHDLQIRSKEDVSIMESYLKHDCQVTRVKGYGKDFMLTSKDIEILRYCPVEKLHLDGTACLSADVKDLSVLTNLKHLSLAYCTQVHFTVSGLPSVLEWLDIRGLKLENLHVQLDASDHVWTEDYLTDVTVSSSRMCCKQAVHEMFGRALKKGSCNAVGCKQNSDGYFICDIPTGTVSSCDDLIENPILRVLLWMMAITAFCGNLIVIVYRLVWDTQCLRHPHGIFVLNLSVSDLLTGIYLLIIAGADTRFRGRYVLHDSNWRYGAGCHLAGFITTFSCETSAMFILLITVDRFLAIQFPHSTHRLSPQVNRMVCSATWMIGLVIAAVPLLVPNWEVYAFNSICVGLPLNTEEYPGESYATGIFIGMNSVIFLLIAVGQVLIYRANRVNTSKVAMFGARAKRRYKEDLAIARHLSLVVVTDFCCWFPICIMGLMAQSGYAISSKTYAWSAVVVMPINSALNPFLYTMPALKKLYKHVKNTYLSKVCHICLKADDDESSNDTSGNNTADENITMSLEPNDKLKVNDTDKIASLPVVNNDKPVLTHL